MDLPHAVRSLQRETTKQSFRILTITPEDIQVRAIIIDGKKFFPRCRCVRCGKLIGNFLAQDNSLIGEERAVQASGEHQHFGGVFCPACAV